MTEDYLIKKIEVSDIENLSSLHIKTFKSFFLTSLGKQFLKKFYLAVISHPKAVAIGYYQHNKIIGFAVGATINSGFYKQIIKKHFFQLLIPALPKLLFCPRNIYRIFSNLFSNHVNINHEGGVLLSLCVDPDEQGKGIGKKLLFKFEDLILQNGIKYLYLTTDAEQNEKTNHFYLSSGYEISQQIKTRYGRLMNIYCKMLIK